MNYVNLFYPDAEGKIIQTCTVLENVRSNYEAPWTEGEVPQGMTHFINGVFQNIPNLENAKQQKRLLLNHALNKSLNRTFIVNGHSFTFSNIETALPSALSGSCTLMDDIGVLVSLTTHQVALLKDMNTNRLILLHNASTMIGLMIQSAATNAELEAIDLTLP